MAGATTEIVDLGDDDVSSRSASPASDAIDLLDDDIEAHSNRPSRGSTAQQQPQGRSVTSPRSGATTGQPGRLGGAGSPSSRQQQQQRGGAGSKRKNVRNNINNEGQIGPEDYEDYAGGNGGAATAGIMMQEGTSSGPGRSAAAAYDRLLDLDYPRGMLRCSAAPVVQVRLIVSAEQTTETLSLDSTLLWSLSQASSSSSQLQQSSRPHSRPA